MYTFYGQAHQDKFIFERYFPKKRGGISIECGAFDGIMESSTLFFEKNLNWVTINIEASPPMYRQLEINRVESNNFNLGLSNKEGEFVFKHVIHPNHGENFGNGSFKHNSDHKNMLVRDNCRFEDYNVKTTTYKNLIDNFMDKNYPNNKIDLFVLDVEGYELEVIEGMKNSNYLPSILCVEFPFVGLDTLKKLILELEYKFDITENNNAYFIHNNHNLDLI